MSVCSVGSRTPSRRIFNSVCVCVCVRAQVYDIAFSRAGGGRDMFASVGADGSVRMFDLRHLEHSTIIYEDPQHHPLLRLCWNKQDPNYLATMAMDGMEVHFTLFFNALEGIQAHLKCSPHLCFRWSSWMSVCRAHR